jgi:predicted small secreted protein
MPSNPSVRRLRLAILLAGLMAGATILSACNTIGGAGEDISAAGRAIERSAERTAN